MIKNYDPSHVTVSFGEVNIRGFMDSTFVEAERDEDAFTKHVGSLGDTTRTRNLNRGGKVTITLIHVAPTNDLLYALLFADEQFGLSVRPLMIKDINGNMRCHAIESWIQKAPKVERGKESGSVQWVFDCAQLSINPGGNDFI